jgi:hypothetical protein
MFKLKLGPITVYRGSFARACDLQDRFEFLKLYQKIDRTWHLLEI